VSKKIKHPSPDNPKKSDQFWFIDRTFCDRAGWETVLRQDEDDYVDELDLNDIHLPPDNSEDEAYYLQDETQISAILHEDIDNNSELEVAELLSDEDSVSSEF
jgi:hypothetical protein